jgi:hydroxyethylthiazole kinase-like uncharacterized protein yjeF
VKLLSAHQLREADQITTERQGISSFQLMQRASAVCADVICNRFSPEIPVTVFSGTGNNGGDGLCIARILHRVGYQVVVHVIRTSSNPAADFLLAKSEFEDTPGAWIREGLPDSNNINQTLVIDALFGTGINGPVTGPGLSAIQFINNSGAQVVSIDMPSGMPADPVTGELKFEMVQASLTITFTNPKLSMLLPRYGESTGELITVDIGLDTDYISHIPNRYHVVTPDLIIKLYRPRNRFSNKGTFGHSMIVAGSKGKIGAALLASKACLRSGTGLLTLHIPVCGYIPAQTAIPEAMVSTDPHDDRITALPDLNNITALGIGPGLGTHPETVSVLTQLLSATSHLPLVLDADALNILSLHPELLKHLHPSSVLTPHPGEFRRLAGEWNGDAEMLQKAEDFASSNKCVVVLKGHRTLLTDGTQTWFNSTGNNGMAKGGTGDVLCGLVTGLIASGYPSLDAAILGVFLHGRAGDLAAMKKSPEGMTAGHLATQIGAAWKSLF